VNFARSTDEPTCRMESTLAIAPVAQVDVYVTNDRKVRNLIIDGIKFFAGLDGTIF